MLSSIDFLCTNECLKFKSQDIDGNYEFQYSYGGTQKENLTIGHLYGTIN